MFIRLRAPSFVHPLILSPQRIRLIQDHQQTRPGPRPHLLLHGWITRRRSGCHQGGQVPAVPPQVTRRLCDVSHVVPYVFTATRRSRGDACLLESASAPFPAAPTLTLPDPSRSSSCHSVQMEAPPRVLSAASVLKGLCYRGREELQAGFITAGWDRKNGPQVGRGVRRQ